MSGFELDLDAPQASGRPRDGGSFHMSFRSGSRATGACAASAYDYIAREGPFDDPEFDRAVYTESGNMPSWAEDDPRAYWDAADLYERANGRLFVGGDFALPRGFDVEDQVDVARTLVKDLTDREHLPYTFAIHAGENQDGHEHNPHVHVMISERGNDGLERSPPDWFRRANRQHAERGGAAKSRAFHGRDWVEHARERLADAINDRLRQRGREDFVDHRSHERQGIDREPGEHIGPEAAHLFERTGDSDRLEQALANDNTLRSVADLDDRIERLEQIRASLVLEEYALDHGQDYPSRTSGDGFARESGPER
jgi:MobA/MobL family